MKRIISVFLISVIMLTSASVYVCAATQLLGDIDSNGKVELYDARLALRYAIGLNKPTNHKKNIADWNRDGNVTSSDARKILRTAMGIEETKTLKETTTKKQEESTTKKSSGKTRYVDGSFNEIPGPEVLEEGAIYMVLYPDGTQETKYVPVTTPAEPVDLHHCDYCGKNTDDVNGHNACAYGGCCRWLKDITCPECGVFVPARTCHTCK